jgi:hypothetical protein
LYNLRPTYPIAGDCFTRIGMGTVVESIEPENLYQHFKGKENNGSHTNQKDRVPQNAPTHLCSIPGVLTEVRNAIKGLVSLIRQIETFSFDFSNILL